MSDYLRAALRPLAPMAVVMTMALTAAIWLRTGEGWVELAVSLLVSTFLSLTIVYCLPALFFSVYAHQQAQELGQPLELYRIDDQYKRLLESYIAMLRLL